MKPTRTYPRLHIDTAPSNALGQAGGMLLTETVHTSSLGHHLKQALAAWKKPFAIHDPAKILTDIAITLALGGDALSDSSVIRDEPDLDGPVTSNPTITRRSPDSSALSPLTPTTRWLRSTLLGQPPVPACGNSPGLRHRTMTVMPRLR